VPAAKTRLKGMGRPIPEPDPDAVARMKQEQLYQQKHHQVMALKMPMSMIKGDPDFSTAAHGGTPQLNPPNDVVSATDVLRPGAQGPAFTVAGGAASSQTPAETGTEPVTPEDARTGPAAGSDGQPSVGVEIISTGPDSQPGTTAAPAGATSTPVNTPGNAPGSASGSAPGSAPETTANPAADANAPATGNAAVASPNASGSPAPVADAGAAAAPAGSSTSTDAAHPATTSSSTADSSTATKATPVDTSEESSSKKKKGIKKIIPW
jgi:hypothetical protein